MNKIFENIKYFFKTIFFFLVALIAAPFLFLTFIGVHYSNEFWEYLLAAKYPSLEISKSKKIRTLIDTPRNAGIFHFLLEVEGKCDYSKIKEHYVTNLTEKLNKFGELRFPKIKQKLITCWGHYAWIKDSSSFNIDHHILQSTGKYRGRPVTEVNLQDYVSDLVTKYIPSNIPQWQVIVIPISCDVDKYYILIKIHHLLLAEEENIHINEILMLSGSEKLSMQSADTLQPPKLSNFVDKPKNILRLWNHISMVIANHWNEFIYRYDSVDVEEIEKKPSITCLSQLSSALFITVITVITDYFKGRKKVRHELKYQGKFLLNLIKREGCKRNLSWEAAIDSIFWSMNPINIIKNILKFIVILNISKLLYAPILVCKEISALKDLIFKGHTQHTSTFLGLISVYVPMILYALVEFFNICKEIFIAPRNIFEELFQLRSKESNILQVKSYSGRKVVAFSKAVDLSEVRQRCKIKTNIYDSEIMLTCLSGALKKFFEIFEDHSVPSHLNATCRSLSKDYFLEKYEKTNHIGGVVFLQLPLKEPNLEQFKDIHDAIARIRSKQISIYLASLGQTKFDLLTAVMPRVLMKVFINYFSFNFPVTITEIYGDSSQFQTTWGHRIKDILLFRPPQSKTCLSLNIHRFGDLTRLAIMADTQLAPNHVEIATHWDQHMQNFTLK